MGESTLKLKCYEAVGEILWVTGEMDSDGWAQENPSHELAIERIQDTVICTILWIHTGFSLDALGEIQNAIDNIWAELVSPKMREDGGMLNALRVAVDTIERWNEFCDQREEGE